MRERNKIVNAVILPLTLGASIAFAQEQGLSDVGEEVITLDTIIVTATKRQTSTLDAPLSLAVVEGDSLDDRNITNVEELQTLVTGFTSQERSTTRSASFTVRGIGTSTFSDSIEDSVAVVIDGVTIGRLGGALSDLDEIERVEVLRGPQGTLFGKNASAGLVNITTKAPTDEFSFSGRVSIGDQGEEKVRAAVSGPLSDTTTYRLSAYNNKRDGIVDNVFDGGELNDSDETGFRAKLAFAPSETFSGTLAVDYADSETECCTWTIRSNSSGELGTGLFGSGFNIIGTSQAQAGIDPSAENVTTLENGTRFAEQDSGGVTATMEWKLGGHTLTSITGYREWNQIDNNPADQTTLGILDTNIGDLRQDQFSQELRLTSPIDQFVEYVVGLYYFEQSTRTLSEQTGSFGLDLLGVIPTGVDVSRNLDIIAEPTNIAAFGEAVFNVSDSLRLLAGARVLREEQDLSFSRVSNPTAEALVPVLGAGWTSANFNDSLSDDAVTFRVGFQQDISDTGNIYGFAGRGYKGPAFNSNVDTVELREIEPEIPEFVELGLKTRAFDERLELSLSAFYTEFQDYQAESFTPGPSGVLLFDITNAGELETKGVELEFALQASANLKLYGGFSYVDAVFAEFTNGPCTFAQSLATPNCVQDLTGEPLPNSPETSFNLNMKYDFELASNPAFFQLSYYWRDETITSLDGDPNTVVDAYGLLDLAAGIRFGKNGRYSLSVYGKNLTDEYFVEGIFDTPFDSGGYSQFVTPIAERRFGVSFGIDL